MENVNNVKKFNTTEKSFGAEISMSRNSTATGIDNIQNF